MKLRRKSKTEENICEKSLILFCANYKKERLEKIRKKYKTKECLRCMNKTITKKSQSSTPLLQRKAEQKDRVKQTDQNLFFNALSPISTRHNTLERIKRENIVKRELFEKSLVAIIAEARKELKKEDEPTSESSNYVNMDANSQANNNSKLIKDQNYEEFQDYVEDEIYEDVLFEQKPKENFYEHVSFNIYEPIGFK